jgi:subtilisin-like proprotein convertase family protein
LFLLEERWLSCSVTHVNFETGSSELAQMQHKTYVAAGRFIVESGKPVTVEYKISEVAV